MIYSTLVRSMAVEWKWLRLLSTESLMLNVHSCENCSYTS